MRKLTLLDWKSSKGFYDEMAIQVSAYARAYNRAQANPEDLVTALGVLRLDKETGMPEYHDCTEGEAARWRGFCGILDYYHALIEPTITERSRDRFYEEGGLRGPSVTTVLGCLAKPALIQWAANCSAEFIAENISEIRNPETTPERIEQLIKASRSAHRTVGKKAADIGSLVHDAIETYMKGGDPNPVIVGNEKAENAFQAFLDWKSKVELEPVALEKQIFHPILRYGGRPDCIGYLTMEGQ